MLNFRTYAGLGLLQFLFHSTQRVFLHHFADVALHRNVPDYRLVRVLGTPIGALVASVAKYHGFIAVEQLVGLRHVGHVSGCGHQRMRQAQFGINATVAQLRRYVPEDSKAIKLLAVPRTRRRIKVSIEAIARRPSDGRKPYRGKTVYRLRPYRAIAAAPVKAGTLLQHRVGAWFRPRFHPLNERQTTAACVPQPSGNALSPPHPRPAAPPA